jgi:alkylhydroperoxidase family enzyme
MSERPVRITPQAPEEWDAATAALLGAVVGVGSVRRPVHLPAVIARHPTFLGPYLDWAKAVALQGVLSPRHTELLALRTAVNCSSAFEWGVHTQYATSRGGLSDDEVAAVAHGPGAAAWDELERALLRAADELHATSSVGDGTWAVLARHLDEAALLEAVFVVGHTTMLSMVANASGAVGDPSWPDLPADLPSRSAR